MVVVALCAFAFAGPAWAGPHEHEAEPDDPVYFDGTPSPTYAIDCNEHEDVGYVQGSSFTITVVTVDGKPVEVETANAYYAMQQAAAADGVSIKVVSGFRTMAEQEYLYGCYINCNCNNCNLAAKPGYSNHQSGHALDLNTAAAGVLNWLEAHGDEFGFEATVPSEDWHWEWWGGGPATNGPCGTPDYRAEYVSQSFPLASQPPVLLLTGECIDAWIDLRNTGDAAWNGDTRLAPTPRDQPSPLHDPATWLSPTRIATAGDVAPGAVGRFEFRLCGEAPGEVFQTFSLVQEGTTWFADKPLGGGPPDDQLEVRVLVVDPAPPFDPPPPPLPPPPGPTGTDGESEGEGDSGTTGDEEPTTGAATTGAGEPSSDGETVSAGGSAGAAEDEGCGCRGSAPGSAWGLVALGLLARRRRKR
ncbi:D-alanyl-D-alanine carboxypeptidase family protein [Nannocystis pusilla]|uniref:D-alanyl-D-alanine carboxypeptidase family protein n=1 Tax=Nannocystis pusilla TaxID=889268 RepID=A0ABS7TV50_9BACT|nr:D-alanyl-D-alanine carboxypeptidase family protein [Nannocystis pusilla]MBZ5712138.1 D-alanyl-D-alanine carboxypeptidase family protein [Nannocystis pusilla]